MVYLTLWPLSPGNPGSPSNPRSPCKIIIIIITILITFPVLLYTVIWMWGIFSCQDTILKYISSRGELTYKIWIYKHMSSWPLPQALLAFLFLHLHLDDPDNAKNMTEQKGFLLTQSKRKQSNRWLQMPSKYTTKTKHTLFPGFPVSPGGPWTPRGPYIKTPELIRFGEFLINKLSHIGEMVLALP